MSNKTSPGSSRDKVLHALHQLGHASAADIATTAGVAYSTTTATLRRLEQAGAAARHKTGEGNLTWHPTTAPDTHQAATQAATTKLEKDREPAGESPQPEKAADSTEGEPDPPPDAERVPQGTADGDPPRDVEHPTNPVGHEQAAAGAADSTPILQSDTAAATGSGRPRRAHGALRAEVLGVLQDAPQHTFKVSQVCKHLPGASAGAVNNALLRLLAQGSIRQVADKPATYQAD